MLDFSVKHILLQLRKMIFKIEDYFSLANINEESLKEVTGFYR